MLQFSTVDFVLSILSTFKIHFHLFSWRCEKLVLNLYIRNTWRHRYLKILNYLEKNESIKYYVFPLYYVDLLIFLIIYSSILLRECNYCVANSLLYYNQDNICFDDVACSGTSSASLTAIHINSSLYQHSTGPACTNVICAYQCRI